MTSVTFTQGQILKDPRYCSKQCRQIWITRTYM